MPTNLEKLRNQAVWYACQWIGRPYSWGGDDFTGFDCSGYIHEIFQGIGIERRGFDSTADEIMRRFIESLDNRIVSQGKAGCLVFWLTDMGRARHVEFMIDENWTLGASGGGKPGYVIKDLVDRYPKFFGPIFEAADNAGNNPLYWLISKWLRYWEADKRNSFIRMNPAPKPGPKIIIVDPFKEVD